MANKYDTHAAHMAQNRVYVITHPKKTGHAEIIVKFPKDGAGRLKVSLRDCFGETCEFSTGYAGGWGYDKETAAISGLVVDGHTITDHCAQDATSEKLLNAYAKVFGDALRCENVERAAKSQGYSFTNWESGKGWASCYKVSGLDYLRALGYRIITVG